MEGWNEMSFVTGTATELLYASTAVGVSQASFTAEQQMNTTGTMGVQAHIPPDFWLPNQASQGRGIKILARGTLASTVTPTYTVTVRGGAAANTTTAILCGTAAMTTMTTQATQMWEFEADCILKTIGIGGVATSTLCSVGCFRCDGIASSSNMAVAGGLTTAGTLVAPGTVATLDTSITNYINFNVACSASSVSNIFALQQLLVFGLN
jgi:hypothetical protein